MNEQQFLVISTTIKAAYPNATILPDRASMNVWYELLKDLEYEACKSSVIELISTNKFPPSIAEIREKYSAKTNDRIKTPGEAYESVMTAISKFGRNEPQKAYETMDEATVKTVKQLGYGYLCNSENMMADRANFMKLYEVIAKEKKIESQLPEMVQIGNSAAVGQIEGK